MMFIALVLALALQQVLSPDNVLQSRRWLLACDDMLSRYVSAPTPRLVVLLLAVLLIGDAVLERLGDWSFGLPALLASAALLLWSLGNEDYHTALERLAAQDAAGAPEAVEGVDPPLWQPPSEAEGGADPDPHQRLLYVGFARWFTPLFYFALAGPLGALVYRAIAVLTAREPDAMRLRLLWLLDWIPARLLLLTFALAGDFLAVSRRLRDGDALRAPTPELLAASARDACGGQRSARAIGDLLYRCAGLWLLAWAAGSLLF